MFRSFSALKREAARRLHTRNKPKLLRLYRVDGNVFERWLLKTVINVGIGMTRHSWWPSDTWVRKAFGASDFAPPEGMYLVPGGDVYDGKQHKFAIDLLADGERPVGGLLDLDGLSFAICAEPYDPRQSTLAIKGLSSAGTAANGSALSRWNRTPYSSTHRIGAAVPACWSAQFGGARR